MVFYTDFIDKLNAADKKYNASDKGAYVLIPLTYGIHYEIRKEVRGSENFEIRVDFEMPSAEANQIASQKFQAFCRNNKIPVVVAFSGARNGEWQRVVIFRDKTKTITVDEAVEQFANLYEKTAEILKKFQKDATTSFATVIFEKEVSLNDEADRKNVAETLARAEKNREIEISMYWQRSAYFIVFIGAILTAYLSDNTSCKPLLCVFLLSLGGLISFIWYLTTRGAKYWQENWEKMCEKIEAIQKNHIYSVYPLEESKFGNLLSKRRYSVSRANSLIALISTVACFILAVAEIIAFYDCGVSFVVLSVIALIISIIACYIAEKVLRPKGETKND